MIYEKREKGTYAVRADMPDIRGDFKRASEKAKKEQGAIQITDSLPYKRNVGRKRKVPRLAFAALIVFCVFAFDKTVLNGSLSYFLGECAAKGADYALENMTESEKGDVTLYTRLVTNVPEKVPPKETDAKENFPTEEEEVVPTAGEVASPEFSDGVKYYPISYLDLSAKDIYALSNETAFSPDVGYLSGQTPRALKNVDATAGPLVLIVHTHGEECYTEYTDMYPEGEATRSTDVEKNVVRVGEEIANTLNDFGVATLHCTKMHDSESFINAYSSSAASVREYLEQNPSIRIVVDVHRDAVIRNSGESLAAVTEIAGEKYAQLMFVVGTNELGHNHPDWQDNLTLALNLQKSLDDTYPTLCRSINLRNVPFNQQLSSGYLLLEVGTSANTLDQALRSARAFGENLARSVMMS